MPIRNSMRRSGGKPTLRSIIEFWISTAQRTASTTLRNSTMAPSPVRFTTRPLWTAIVGSIRSLRRARSLARVRSSSVPASRLNPTTSVTSIAASFLDSSMPRLPQDENLAKLAHLGTHVRPKATHQAVAGKVQPGLPPWGPHVRFRRVQTLVREGSPLVKLRNSA